MLQFVFFALKFSGGVDEFAVDATQLVDELVVGADGLLSQDHQMILGCIEVGVQRDDDPGRGAET